jgi:hypothetical protein
MPLLPTFYPNLANSRSLSRRFAKKNLWCTAPQVEADGRHHPSEGFTALCLAITMPPTTKHKNFVFHQPDAQNEANGAKPEKVEPSAIYDIHCRHECRI